MSCDYGVDSFYSTRVLTHMQHSNNQGLIQYKDLVLLA